VTLQAWPELQCGAFALVLMRLEVPWNKLVTYSKLLRYSRPLHLADI
jgi:hypothetical protein